VTEHMSPEEMKELLVKSVLQTSCRSSLALPNTVV
jgi:hypothetical protein